MSTEYEMYVSLTPGYVGQSGYSGYSGTLGYSGYSGFNGASGWSGYSGYSGYSGNSDGQYAVSDGTSTSTDTAFTTKVSLTFTPSSAGLYSIFWSCEVTNNTAVSNRYTRVQVVLDGTTTFAGEQQFQMVLANLWLPACGLYQTTLTAVSHTIDLQFATSNAAGTASIRNARIIARKA